MPSAKLFIAPRLWAARIAPARAGPGPSQRHTTLTTSSNDTKIIARQTSRSALSNAVWPGTTSPRPARISCQAGWKPLVAWMPSKLNPWP